MMIKSRKMRWARHVKRTREKINTSEVVFPSISPENLKGRDHLENLGLGGRILRWNLK
jgi:hypothetical protein